MLVMAGSALGPISLDAIYPEMLKISSATQKEEFAFVSITRAARLANGCRQVYAELGADLDSVINTV